MGQSDNLVKSKIRIASSVYVLVTKAKKRFKKKTTYEIFQFFSMPIFKKAPMNLLFTECQLQSFKAQSDNQLKMFAL